MKGEYCEEDRPDCLSVDDQWQVKSHESFSGYGWDDKCKADSTLSLCDGVRYEQMPKEALVEEARRRITRNFTRSEWQDYFGDEPYIEIDTRLP